MNEALSDVVKEQIAQKQNFENLQPPQNLNYDEVDRTYNPPDGWIGFGLNVINKYDNRNNDWLA